MQTLNLVLSNHAYPIHIGNHILTKVDLYQAHLKQNKVVIISNDTVAPLYLNALQTALHSAGIHTDQIILPDGEAFKNWESLNMIFDGLLQEKAERQTTLIALGGGVIGDITGFAAACYQRGVPFIQVPTTLLAQVDSSVGGKTAINHPLGKNMIGAFYQPQAVIADIALLQTLPKRELAAGLAEVIKYALLGDIHFLKWLEEHLEPLLQLDYAALSYAVAHCCQMKANIVEQDEKENDIRALLNLGHTFGHAIETSQGYGKWLHGEAVAIGMAMAAKASQYLGNLSSDDVNRVIKLLERAGLPTQAPQMNYQQWLEYMSQDKKVKQGKIQFVLMKQLGKAYLSTLNQDAILAALN